jgi:hypothetical protein
MSTPPYGQDYGGEGYGYDVPASPAEDPRRQGSRANGGGEADRATRPVYQPDGYQRGSTYPQRTYPLGNGYRGPYDPRGGDRRLAGAGRSSPGAVAPWAESACLAGTLLSRSGLRAH